MLSGAAELASHVCKLPVRVGNPLPTPGLSGEYTNPSYATAIGLALEGNDRENRGIEEGMGEPISTRTGGDFLGIGKSIGKLIDWLKKEFF
jgi:cell division protein FtsA